MPAMFMPFIYRVHIEDSVHSLVVMKYCEHAACVGQDSSPMYLYNNVYMCVCMCVSAIYLIFAKNCTHKINVKFSTFSNKQNVNFEKIVKMSTC